MMNTETEMRIANEELLIRAIRNMQRKLNFRELEEQFENGEITYPEYVKEVDDNKDKYVIQMREATKDEAWRVGLLVHRMGLQDPQIHEVEEMFGLNLSKCIKMK